MKIAFAYHRSDCKLAELIKSLLHQLGHEVLDFGASDNKTDPPDMAYCTGRAVLNHNAERAILVCESGMCSCIAANKMAGLYAAPCYDIVEAHIARSRYNTNVLCLSDCWTDNRTALNIVKEWLNTPYAKSTLTLRALTKLKTIEAEQCQSSSSDTNEASQN